MGLISADLTRVVEAPRPGFVATVCPDGTPNRSPKGTTAVWNVVHLVSAHIRSPGTRADLRQHPSVEVHVGDPFVRQGDRFKGVAAILDSGPRSDAVITCSKARGAANVIREVVMVRVPRAQPIDSPAYDLGLTAAEVCARWERHGPAVQAGTTASPAGESCPRVHAAQPVDARDLEHAAGRYQPSRGRPTGHASDEDRRLRHGRRALWRPNRAPTGPPRVVERATPGRDPRRRLGLGVRGRGGARGHLGG